jgi:glutamyl-tRNA synthetase
MRVEDLDPSTRDNDIAQRQLDDLQSLGLDWDGPVVVQSSRLNRHHQAIGQLTEAGLTYPCWCTRREVAEASQAPNQPGLPEGAYQGTCAGLDERARAERASYTTRPPALRLRANAATITFDDAVHGPFTGTVDDFVIRRSDGVPAYNLAVVVDDADQGVDQVVRGDDLLDSTPRQIVLHHLLGLAVPQYAHVPLVLSTGGGRMAKRGQATTLGELAHQGVPPQRVLGWLATSLGLASAAEVVTVATLLERFNPAGIPRTPWYVTMADEDFSPLA